MLKQIVEQGVISHTAPPSAPPPPPFLRAHRLARRLVHYAGRGTADRGRSRPYDSRAMRTDILT